MAYRLTTKNATLGLLRAEWSLVKNGGPDCPTAIQYFYIDKIFEEQLYIVNHFPANMINRIFTEFQLQLFPKTMRNYVFCVHWKTLSKMDVSLIYQVFVWYQSRLLSSVAIA